MLQYILSVVLDWEFGPSQPFKNTPNTQSMAFQTDIWVPTAITTVLLLSAIYFVARFISYEIKKPSDDKTPHLMFYSGLSFFAVSCGNPMMLINFDGKTTCVQ